MSGHTVKSKIVNCPMGTGSQLVEIEVTCKNCGYFQRISPKNATQGIPERVECIIPTKFRREVAELVEVDFSREV